MWNRVKARRRRKRARRRARRAAANAAFFDALAVHNRLVAPATVRVVDGVVSLVSLVCGALSPTVKMVSQCWLGSGGYRSLNACNAPPCLVRAGVYERIPSDTTSCAQGGTRLARHAVR